MIEQASVLLIKYLDQVTEKSTFGDALTAVKAKGYGLLITALALVVVLPAPPGVDALPGLVLLVWAVHRLIGHPTPWLPRFIRERTMPPRFLNLLRAKGIPFLQKMENLLPARGLFREANPWEDKAVSLTAILMAILVVVPTPFLNSIPAAVLVAVGLGMLNGNKYLIWSSVLAGLVAFTVIGNILWVSTDFVIDWFMSFQEQS